MDGTNKYRIWFFAGGDYGKGSPNLFTGSFIRMMYDRYGSGFRVVEGIYNRYPFMNVFWALGHAQRQAPRPDKINLLRTAYQQIVSSLESTDSGLFLISSSYGSVVAAQTACYIAREIQSGRFPELPVHVAIGASMISKKSELYRQLLTYQEDGVIGKIIFDELQDEGDNSTGLGGTSRIKAYLHALGICFPFLTWKYSGPSFLNTNPKTGHLHRRRAQTVEKAEDFMREVEKMVAGCRLPVRPANDRASAARPYSPCALVPLCPCAPMPPCPCALVPPIPSRTSPNTRLISDSSSDIRRLNNKSWPGRPHVFHRYMLMSRTL